MEVTVYMISIRKQQKSFWDWVYSNVVVFHKQGSTEDLSGSPGQVDFLAGQVNL